jgi:hypothetical protein
MHTNSATIEIAQPKLFTMGAVVAANAYGLLLVAPLFISIMAVSVMTLSILTLLIPLLVVAATAYFLPFGLGNTHITRLVRSLTPAATKDGEGFRKGSVREIVMFSAGLFTDPAEIVLTWQTTPPRMPIPAPAT